ncbi:hypothetical protein NDU88_011674 [Pleurodeles waltl]|uniref:Uncharacterized protein n=1 Tax=Pleurodeles waltl TaxID=8319 RepID=A0AAV7S657_PLEWA|nr:hypothetical protein NDU88_011674 [Pleurodeles waltl]
MKYLHPSSHGNRGPPRGNPREKHKQIMDKKECTAAAQLRDKKSQSITDQLPSSLIGNNLQKQQEEGGTGLTGHGEMELLVEEVKMKEAHLLGHLVPKTSKSTKDKLLKQITWTQSTPSAALRSTDDPKKRKEKVRPITGMSGTDGLQAVGLGTEQAEAGECNKVKANVPWYCCWVFAPLDADPQP